MVFKFYGRQKIYIFMTIKSGREGIRTLDQLIKSQLLYQLSYKPKKTKSNNEAVNLYGQHYNNQALLWGERPDSNRRHSVPQTDTLTN